MQPNPWENLLLRQPGEGDTKYFRAHREGKTVVTSSWSDRRKPRETRKAAKDAQGAHRALDEAVRKKLLEGFVYARDPAEAAPGELFFAARAPGGCSGETFDVDAAGSTVFLAAGRGDPKAALVVIDVASGLSTRRDVRPPSPGDQLFIHAAILDIEARKGLYALGTQLREHDLDSGAERVVASFREEGKSMFNPFCVKPCADQARRRVVACMPKNTLAVLDLATGKPLCSVVANTKTAECRAVGISPSGKLLAAYLVSRHIAYGHEDARNDKTNEVIVWRVDGGDEVRRVAMPTEVRELGFSHDDSAILVSHEPASGPRGYSLKTGKRSLDLSGCEGDEADRVYRFSWSFSPDGGTLALGEGRAVALVDPATGAEQGRIASECDRPSKLVFAADGRRLFLGGGGLVEGRVVR